jgi:hypothetical protein
MWDIGCRQLGALIDVSVVEVVAMEEAEGGRIDC